MNARIVAIRQRKKSGDGENDDDDKAENEESGFVHLRSKKGLRPGELHVDLPFCDGMLPALGVVLRSSTSLTGTNTRR